MQVTIAKNRTAPILSQIVSAKSFNLDNGFSGHPIQDIGRLISWLNRSGSFKMVFNKETGRGSIKEHSNSWIEFETKAL